MQMETIYALKLENSRSLAQIHRPQPISESEPRRVREYVDAQPDLNLFVVSIDP